MSNQMWVFDFDGTLVETDKKEVTDFDDIEMNVTEVHQRTYKLFYMRVLFVGCLLFAIL